MGHGTWDNGTNCVNLFSITQLFVRLFVRTNDNMNTDWPDQTDTRKMIAHPLSSYSVEKVNEVNV